MRNKIVKTLAGPVKNCLWSLASTEPQQSTASIKDEQHLWESIFPLQAYRNSDKGSGPFQSFNKQSCPALAGSLPFTESYKRVEQRVQHNSEHLEDQ